MNFNNKKFVEQNLNNLKQINKMKKEIKESGGLFYQYRACRIDENIIYDIENILHGVVYARSPLYMNDPFDSEIGFSTEKILDDILDLFLEDYNCNENVKNVLRFIIRNKMLGQFATLIQGLNEIKKELRILFPKDLSQQQINNIKRQIDTAIRKLPKQVQKIFNKKNVTYILFLILSINERRAGSDNAARVR